MKKDCLPNLFRGIHGGCSVYGRGRNLDRAMEMFNVTRSMGIPLDEKIYTNLICYYGKAGMYLFASENSSQFSTPS